MIEITDPVITHTMTIDPIFKAFIDGIIAGFQHCVKAYPDIKASLIYDTKEEDWYKIYLHFDVENVDFDQKLQIWDSLGKNIQTQIDQVIETYANGEKAYLLDLRKIFFISTKL